MIVRCASGFLGVIAIVLSLIPFGYADAQQYRATSLSLAEGLSQSSVYSVVQDSQGFTWLATQDGLNKYDGISFTVYREEPFDTQSVSSGNISALHCDGLGRLWVGTNSGGLNLFNSHKGTFTHLSHGRHDDPGRIINSIISDRQGAIWVAADNGLYRIGKDIRPVNIPLLTEPGDTVPDKFVNTLFCDKDGNVWAGTFQGLFLITSGAVAAEKPIAVLFDTGSSDRGIVTLSQDSFGRLWIGTRSGIEIRSLQSSDRMRLAPGSNGQSGMRSGSVLRLFCSSSGEMWVGYQEKGLQKAKFDNVTSDILFTDVEALNGSGLLKTGTNFSLFEDRITPGMIWAGFNAGGIIRLAPVTKKFVTDNLQHPDIPVPFVTSLVKDAKDVIWIATSSGLIRKDTRKNEYKVLLPSEFTKDPGVENYIGGVAIASGGEVLFTAGTKVMRVINEGQKCEIVPNTAGEVNYLRTIFKDTDGAVYVLSRFGAVRYNPSRKVLEPYLEIKNPMRLKDRGFYVSCMLHDRRGNLWVGTSSGLDFYASGKSLQSKPVTFHHHRNDTTSLRSHTILSLFEDRNGRVWAGTMNGLSRIVPGHKGFSFLNYSTHNGLSNNVVYAVIQDTRDQKLWLSTNNGLTLFDPDGSPSAVFDVHDGIQSNEFNSYAASIAPDGEIFFGGINGYTSFYPNYITADTTSPRVAITGITLGNGRFIPFEHAGVIDLKYRDNNFSVNFIGLHYVDPQKNRYAYKLEGFQDDWITVEGSPKVNFSQLPPGRYTFRVKASNSDGIYNTSDALVVINLLPPFYKTIWFFLVMVLFVLSVLYGLHRYRLKMKLEQIHEIEKLRKATAADFHDELGHKLTIISWFAEILKKKIGPEQKELRPHLDKIIETSGNLYHTMKDMLWAMDPDKDSVFELYNQIRDFGQGLFDETGVMFEADDIPESLKEVMVSPSQRRHVLLIFKEVMHNALKHSGGTDTKLELKEMDKSVMLSFSDNGSGFRMNGQNVGHGLNNVKRRAGLIDAEISIRSEGSGTVARLMLPLN